MPQCAFFTKTQTQCSHQSADGGDYCRTHARIAERLGPRPAGCPCVRGEAVRHQRWCGQPPLEGRAICAYHQGVIEDRAAEAAREALRIQRLTAIAQEFANQVPRPAWQDVATTMWARSRLPRGDPNYLHDRDAYLVIRRYVVATVGPDAYVGIFEFWHALWRAEQGLPGGIWVAQEVAAHPQPPPQPQRPLERLAGDTQNVHREVVVKQTNSNVDLLLAEECLEGQNTLGWMTGWWMNRPTAPKFEDFWRVMEDVRHWYGKRTCKATSDYLYKRALDGLVHKILMTRRRTEDDTHPVDEVFDELCRRLWEECEESVGMCCEGHIARLANVLVGFDETFRPPVPVGEILQTKIAAIAGLKLSHKLKLQKAVAVMDELHIPVDDRAPWLEALAE